MARERHFDVQQRQVLCEPTHLICSHKKLEDELGVMIFERGGEVGITPIGMQITHQAKKVLEASSEIKEIARQVMIP